MGTALRCGDKITSGESRHDEGVHKKREEGEGGA